MSTIPVSTRKMQFLFCSADKFPPFRVDVSVLFGREMVGRGHVIDWILQAEEDNPRAYQTEWGGGDAWVGATDNGSSRLNRVRKHVLSILHDFRMLGLARKRKYDVVQVKDKFISALLGILAAKINGAKFVFWLSYPFPEASLYEARTGTARYKWFYLLRGHFFKLLLYRMIIPASDHVFVQSEQMKRDVMTMGVAEHKLTPVPMGVALENFEVDSIDGSEADLDGEKTLVYLGTLHKVRRIDFLIRVLSKVHMQMPGVRLYLVGGAENPEDEQKLRDEAMKLGVGDSVIFTGYLPQERALRYVRGATLCLSPFFPTPILNSTSPTKLIEYMALGKAVVANDHPEQRLVINESGGGLCVAYDEDEFAEAITTLLAQPARLQEMGRKGRRYVEAKRSYNKLADVLEKKYFEVCGQC